MAAARLVIYLVKASRSFYCTTPLTVSRGVPATDALVLELIARHHLRSAARFLPLRPPGKPRPFVQPAPEPSDGLACMIAAIRSFKPPICKPRE